MVKSKAKKKKKKNNNALTHRVAGEYLGRLKYQYLNTCFAFLLQINYSQSGGTENQGKDR